VSYALQVMLSFQRLSLLWQNCDVQSMGRDVALEELTQLAQAALF